MSFGTERGIFLVRTIAVIALNSELSLYRPKQICTGGDVSMDKPLSEEALRNINAYWRAANYLSGGQIYLCDNPPSARTLGTTPGLNFFFVHLNRDIKKCDLDMIYICCRPILRSHKFPHRPMCVKKLPEKKVGILCGVFGVSDDREFQLCGQGYIARCNGLAKSLLPSPNFA